MSGRQAKRKRKAERAAREKQLKAQVVEWLWAQWDGKSVVLPAREKQP